MTYYAIYQDDIGKWHCEEIDESGEPTGYVIGPFDTERQAKAEIPEFDEPFRCKGCERPEHVCSLDPCEGVIADRES